MKNQPAQATDIEDRCYTLLCISMLIANINNGNRRNYIPYCCVVPRLFEIQLGIHTRLLGRKRQRKPRKIPGVVKKFGEHRLENNPWSRAAITTKPYKAAKKKVQKDGVSFAKAILWKKSRNSDDSDEQDEKKIGQVEPVTLGPATQQIIDNRWQHHVIWLGHIINS